MNEDRLPPESKLAEAIAEFADYEPRERLEALLDFAEGLPPLPANYQALKDAGENRVHECMTPVYLWVEVSAGKVAVFGDVAPEAPTVKGFVGLLREAYDGATPAEVLATPADLLHRLGLVEALGMNRMRGLNAIVQRIRAGVLKATA